MRGGVIENIFVRDIEIGEVAQAAIDITMLYEEGESGPFVPEIRNLRVERMSVEKSGYAILVEALERSPLRGLLVRDSSFRGFRRAPGSMACAISIS